MLTSKWDYLIASYPNSNQVWPCFFFFLDQLDSAILLQLFANVCGHNILELVKEVDLFQCCLWKPYLLQLIRILCHQDFHELCWAPKYHNVRFNMTKDRKIYSPLTLLIIISIVCTVIHIKFSFRPYSILQYTVFIYFFLK